MEFGGNVSGNAGKKIGNFEAIELDVQGNNNVGGLLGNLQSYGDLPMKIENSTIKGMGNNIGGITGTTGGSNMPKKIVINCQIEGMSINSNNVGGIIGNGVGEVSYSTVIYSNIISKGNKIGGIAGYSTNQIVNSYVTDTKVEGISKVGGIAGEKERANISNIYTNAEVKAIEKDAGGLIGYFTNENTIATNIMQIHNNSVEGSKIEAPENVGGLIGYMEKDLYTQTGQNYYYNNYVQAYLISDNSETASLGIGSSKKENDKLTNFHVYKYSKINEQYINEQIDNIQESQYVTADQLKQENTYRNTFGWGTNYLYTTLSENKYPILNNMQTEQEGIDLPEDPIDVETMQANIKQLAENMKNKIPLSINSLTTENEETEVTNSEHNNNKVITPTYEIYPISANEINIDLNNIPEGTYLRIGQGENSVDIEVDTRTYTFKYDFQTPQTLQLIQKSTNNVGSNSISTQTESTAEQTTSTNATNTETILTEIKIDPEEIRNSTSLDGEINAILKGREMYINGEKAEGSYVNIYKGKALTENGEIYDIESQEKDPAENKVEGLILESKVKPREEYEYSGNTIKVYGKYSTINGQAKNQIYTVKNGKLSIISGKTELKIGNQVIDMINEREYETILLENGTIQDLKQSLKYPENFENSNIKDIVQNSDTERPEVLVYYNNGTVIVFNYLTGDITYKQEVQQTIGLVDYIKQSLVNIIPSSTNNTSKEYEESKELVEKLEEVPVEEAIQEVTQNNSTTQETNSNTNTQNTETNNSTEETTQLNSTDTNSSSAGENSSGTINNGSSLTSTQNYVTSYNPETGTYEVYSVEEIINNSKEEPESETQKIQANGLEQFYESYNTSGKKTKIEPGLVIIITTITTIGILSIVIIKRAKYAK